MRSYKLLLFITTVLPYVATACATVPQPVAGADTSGNTPVAAPVTAPDTDYTSVEPTNYSRYDTPAQCERAVVHTTALVWRHGERDTLPYASPYDTLPTAALTIGRTCAARFTVENTDPGQLFFFMRLSLALGNDDQARAALERQLSLAADTLQRGQELLDAFSAYMEAHPMHLAAAESLLIRLDSLGNAARISRLQAHNAILAYWSNVFDTAQIKSEADTVISIGTTLTIQEQNQWIYTLQAPYLRLATVASFEQGPQAAIAVIQQGMSALRTLQNGRGAMSLSTVIRSYFLQASLVGNPMPSITGDYEYNFGSNPTRPIPGRISLFMSVTHNCGNFCEAQYAVLWRLLRRYSATGLDATFIEKTAGFSWGTLPQPPADEAKAVAQYFLGDRKFPVAIVVDTSHFMVLSDGRRIAAPSSFESTYQSPLVLVDRRGIVRYMGAINAGTEAMLNAYIERILNEPVS